MTNLKKLFVTIAICTIGYGVLKLSKHVNKIPNIEY